MEVGPHGNQRLGPSSREAMAEQLFVNRKTRMNSKTQDLYCRAKKRIPGGTQLLCKRPEHQAPDQWPAYFREARGCEVWDLDDRHYYDMSTNGIGSCLLGFRHPEVTAAVQQRISLGSMCSLNPPEEVQLADELVAIHPWAHQARFTRAGGEAMAVAVRIARATTKRSLVAVCGYHGWHDWYLAANLGDNDALAGGLMPGLEPCGVPAELRGTAVPFHFNRPEEIEDIFQRHGDHLAAVVMEPARYHDPEPGFLEMIREGTRQCGALLVFDEITIGWRFHLGGGHLKFEIIPDIAVFAKALGNGHPIGAVLGTEKAMEGAHDSFISSTYWTESVGPVAALATIEQLRSIDVPAYVARVGSAIMQHWQRLADQHGLPIVTGQNYPCLAGFNFEHELSQELRTLYVQLMLERGFLAGPIIYPTLAHTDAIVAKYAVAIDQVFEQISQLLELGKVNEAPKGPVAHRGFHRLT